MEDPFGSCGFDSKDVFGEDIDEELYPSSNVSSYKHWLFFLLGFHPSLDIVKKAFNRLLYLLHTFLLPARNKLQPSCYKAHAMINKRIVPV